MRPRRAVLALLAFAGVSVYQFPAHAVSDKFRASRVQDFQRAQDWKGMQEYCVEWAQENTGAAPLNCQCQAVLSAGDKRAALDICQKAAQASEQEGTPESLAAAKNYWYAIGTIYRDSREFAKSAVTCRSAAKLDENFKEAWFCLGQGRLQTVLEQIIAKVGAAALTTTVDSRVTPIVAANAALLDEAQSALDRYNRLEPNDAGAWFMAATVHILRAEHKPAADKLEKTLALNPEFPGVWEALGEAYFTANRQTEFQNLRHNARMQRREAIVEALERIATTRQP